MKTPKRSKNYGVQAPHAFCISWPALRVLIEEIGSKPAESGAMLCRREGDNQVHRAHFDHTSRNTGGTYSPDTATLNRMLLSINADGERLGGFAHSHPRGITHPSSGDEVYAARILAAIEDMPFMWMPIVQTVPDTGVFALHAYAALRAGAGRVRVVACPVQVTGLPTHDDLTLGGINVLDALRRLPGDGVAVLCIDPRARVHAAVVAPEINADANADTTNASAETDTAPAAEHNAIATAVPAGLTPTTTPPLTFARVEQAYNLPLMLDSRILAVGLGGAGAWAEDCARAGLGQFVLIDADTVSETNLATQQTYRRDIGRLKVDCLAERLLDIHPGAQVKAIPHNLDDLSDQQIEDLAFGPLGGRLPRRTVLCGLTDSFPAQARINRLALKLGLPSLCAQVYREGRGAEITFTFPGVTPACHRCILSSRYAHYLQHAGQNDVTSHGTPIFATTRLNALKGFVLMALLHHGDNHPRWGGLLARIGRRNLVQLRMDPDLASTLGLDVFDKVSGGDERTLFDDVAWLPQDAEAPPKYLRCPDCGGLGDLGLCRGQGGDTRGPLAMPMADGVVSAASTPGV